MTTMIVIHYINSSQSVVNRWGFEWSKFCGTSYAIVHVIFLSFLRFDFVIETIYGMWLKNFAQSTWLCAVIVAVYRAHGNVKHCRKLFQRVINSVSDWPESICEAYIQFEREEGDSCCTFCNLDCNACNCRLTKWLTMCQARHKTTHQCIMRLTWFFIYIIIIIIILVIVIQSVMLTAVLCFFQVY